MKMKFYDKELTKKSEEIKKWIWTLVLFTFGLIIGYFLTQMENQEYIKQLERTIEEQKTKITEQYIELDSLKETVYMYNVYGK